MLVHNQIEGIPSYHSVVADQFKEALNADLIVAYVQQSGVSALKEFVLATRRTRLICSLDMEITDPMAIKSLMDMGVEVKVYQSRRGILHSKFWLFESRDGHRNCLIGSANLSAAALYQNVEVGVLIQESDNPELIEEAIGIFRLMWAHDKCRDVTDEDIAVWLEIQDKREQLNERIKQIEKSYMSSDQAIPILESYVKDWIDIGVERQIESPGVVGRLWRGWYIIPDQGYVNDQLINHLHDICAVIRRHGGSIDISPRRGISPSSPLKKILEFKAERLADRKKHKMKLRSLFVRQEKNYLIHLGFAIHPETPNGRPDKKILELTEAGLHFSRARSTREKKMIYTKSMKAYSYNNMYPLKFTDELIAQTETISFAEFSFFVSHAYSHDEVDNIVKLINIYRCLSPESRNAFIKDMDEYFKEKLEHTAKGVKGNYDKKIRHTMSALGWCKNLQYDADECELKLIYPPPGSRGNF